MPINSIINKKSDYYIAMYSAHATILKNLIGENGTLKKLRVDSGGLKAPRESFENKELFNNYKPETNKTLHAKIIYLDNLRKISLWTGNLRRATIEKQENIILTKRVSEKAKKIIKGWFNENSKGNLIFTVNGKHSINAEISKKCIWDSFKNSFRKINRNEKITLYAFSPWGCTHFVEKIENEIKLFERANIILHTRQCHKETPIWIDAKRNNDSISRFVKKDNDIVFPHYKCVFVTKKVNRREKLIWAYIGSANLTKKAFFETGNIEFAAFFENFNENKEIDSIFQKIKNKSNWEERIPLDKKDIEHDDSKEEYKEDEDNNDNFIIREYSRKLEIELAKRKQQLLLEKYYEKSKIYSLQISKRKYSISVIAIHNGFFDLNVTCKNLTFPLYIKRIYESEIHSEKDIEELLNSLLAKAPMKIVANKKKFLAKTNNIENAINQRRNIRFPIEHFILKKNNKEIIAKKSDILEKLKQKRHLLKKEDDKVIVDIWSQIIEELKK